MTSSMEWIRRNYGVPARHKMRIEYDGQPATIIGTRGPWLAFRIDGDRHITVGHPTYRIVYPQVPEPARPRGWCRHCAKDRAMTKDGVMGQHLFRASTWSEICPGVGQPPTHLVRNQTHPGEQAPTSRTEAKP